ncbi:MAG: LamG domain-containing protein [Bacteroidetes bacterium]|nr:LamG domain-containing protein [Bacteroidota bacterium]
MKTPINTKVMSKVIESVLLITCCMMFSGFCNAQSTLTTGLAAYYKLDGNSNDEVVPNNGNGTDITYSTGNGKIVQGAGFNGTTSKILVPNFSFSGDFSLSGWVKFQSSYAQLYPVWISHETGVLFEFFVSASWIGVSVPSFRIMQSGWKEVDAPSALSIGWHHLVGTVHVGGGATDLKLYVDGVNVASVPSPANQSGTSNLNIGCYPENSPNRVADFPIDEVGIWSRVLTAAEVTQLYNSGNGLTYPFTTTVTTQAVSSITAITATGNGNVTSDGGATITERGVCWNSSTAPTTANNKAISSGTTGAFTASMTGLTSGTLYYVKAYAINSFGTSYGGEVTYTTLAVVPTITTPTVSYITSNSAILGANITSNGGGAITARGTCWGTSANPTTNCVDEGGTATEIFTQARTGLSSSPVIYYRGYAINSIGTGYSADGTFTTLFTPATVNWNISNVQEITLTANRSFTFINGKNGGIYNLIIKQDGTGGRTISWPSNVKWTGGVLPVFTTTVNAVDMIKFIFDGTNFLAQITTLDIK